MVTIQSGALIRIRINQTLDSSHSKPGEHFDGIVVSDVVADGAVAIPRGAMVQGTVVDETALLWWPLGDFEGQAVDSFFGLA